MKLKFGQKIGNQVILISGLSLILTVAIVLSVTLALIKRYNDSILMERAKIGTNILIDTIEQKRLSCEEAYWVEIQSEDFVDAIVKRDASAISKIFTSDYQDADPGMFLLVVAADGKIIFQSDNYPFVSADANMSLSTVNGIVKNGNNLAIFYSMPYDSGHSTYGVTVGFDLASSEWMSKVKNNVECDVTVFRDNIRLVSTIIDPTTHKAVVGTPMGDNINEVVLQQKQSYSGKATIVGSPYYVSYVPMYDYNRQLCGAYFAGSNATEVSKEFSKVTAIAIAIAVAAALITVIVTRAFVITNVEKPILAVSGIAKEMAEGQLEKTEVNYQFKTNEIGIFAGDLKKTREQISGYIGDIIRILGAMGSGDFTKLPNMEYVGDFHQIDVSFHEIENSLADIVTQMDRSADDVSSGASQIANGAQLLAEGTTRQATAIEEINSTVSEITKQVSATAENANKANGYATASLDAVEKQNGQMSSMLVAMTEVKEQSNKISHIIKTIEDIAFQTNILALNASVEAARAGSAGKGFAVVADEVRNLAAKSATAANDTNALISATVKAVDNGVTLAEDTANSMTHVIEQTKLTSQLIGEIDAAAVAQAKAISQVSSGIQDISSVIAQNSATAEETAASCEELASQSNILKSQVDKFSV